EGVDEVRAWFPCPFCYVEIELPLLCVHLQDEHCFDLKNAVCPICAANLGKDALGHFTMQHAHSIKRRKESQKSGFWNNVSSNMVKDFKELSSFLGANSLTGQGSGNGPAPDPLLSPFLCTVPVTVPNDSQDDLSSGVVATSDEHRQVLSLFSFFTQILHEIYTIHM
ncbi:protein dehydration-induced 19 homolog 5, partial [Phtheirospermum japonicum]